MNVQGAGNWDPWMSRGSCRVWGWLLLPLPPSTPSHWQPRERPSPIQVFGQTSPSQWGLLWVPLRLPWFIFPLWHSLPSRILFHLFILSLSLSGLEWKPPAGRNFCLLCSMLCPQCPEQCLAPCRWSVDIWWLNEYEKLMLIDKQALRTSIQGTEDTTWQCNKASKCLWSTCRIYYH